MKKDLDTIEAAEFLRISADSMRRRMKGIDGAYKLSSEPGRAPGVTSKWFIPLRKLQEYKERIKFAVGTAKHEEMESLRYGVES